MNNKVKDILKLNTKYQGTIQGTTHSSPLKLNFYKVLKNLAEFILKMSVLKDVTTVTA